MTEKRFTTSPTPYITVELCGGDLSIAGTEGTEVAFVLEDENDAEVRRDGESFRVSVGGDCTISCPPASSITVRSAGGDFSAVDLTGTLAVQNVGSDASVRGAGIVTLEAVRSDLSVRDVTGDLSIGHVGGDLEVRRVDGKLSASMIGGDLSARSLEGGVDINQVGGDASIETDFTLGKVYHIDAGGDLTLRVAAATNARFKLRAGGEIDRRVDFEEWSGNSHAAQGKLGAGEAQVEMSAGGDLTILPTRGEEFIVDFDAIGSQIEAKMGAFERELEAKMREINEQIEKAVSADIEARLHRVDVSGAGRRAAERAREQAERAAERIREKAERARRQAERTAERARRRSERHSKHGHGFRFNVDFTPPWVPAPSKPPAPPRPPKPPATEQERLMILRMLQEHKISADEAAKLLEALET